MTVHNFKASMETSNHIANASFWDTVYEQAFGGSVASIVNIEKDGWAQRGGIDKIVTLSTGKVITIDEKVRQPNPKTGEDYLKDIALEYLSDKKRKTIGWVEKPLACDYIAYVWEKSQRGYLLPFLTLRKAWCKNGTAWKKLYHLSEAKNEFNGNRWTTVSCCVPKEILLAAMNRAMFVEWEK